MIDNISFKIIELLQDSYVIPGNTNVGIVVEKKDNLNLVYVIDPGTTEVDADYIIDVLDTFFSQKNQQYKIEAIINTHGHADHFGADYFVQKKTGCKIWAPEIDKGGMESPIVLSTMFYGAFSPHELRNPYYYPNPVKVDKFITENDALILSDNRMITYINLPGHSHGSTGIIYTDKDGNKVLFSGDAIFSRSQLAKFWIPYCQNPEDCINSLNKMNDLKNIKWCIPSHGDFITKNFKETIELNILSYTETKNTLLSALSEGRKTTEQLVKYVCDLNDIKAGLTQYNLMTSTLKSYLTILHDEKLIDVKVESNILYWSLVL